MKRAMRDALLLLSVCCVMVTGIGAPSSQRANSKRSRLITTPLLVPQLVSQDEFQRYYQSNFPNINSNYKPRREDILLPHNLPFIMSPPERNNILGGNDEKVQDVITSVQNVISSGFFPKSSSNVIYTINRDPQHTKVNLNSNKVYLDGGQKTRGENLPVVFAPPKQVFVIPLSLTSTSSLPPITPNMAEESREDSSTIESHSTEQSTASSRQTDSTEEEELTTTPVMSEDIQGTRPPSHLEDSSTPTFLGLIDNGLDESNDAYLSDDVTDQDDDASTGTELPEVLTVESTSTTDPLDLITEGYTSEVPDDGQFLLVHPYDDSDTNETEQNNLVPLEGIKFSVEDNPANKTRHMPPRGPFTDFSGPFYPPLSQQTDDFHTYDGEYPSPFEMPPCDSCETTDSPGQDQKDRDQFIARPNGDELVGFVFGLPSDIRIPGKNRYPNGNNLYLIEQQGGGSDPSNIFDQDYSLPLQAAGLLEEPHATSNSLSGPEEHHHDDHDADPGHHMAHHHLETHHHHEGGHEGDPDHTHHLHHEHFHGHFPNQHLMIVASIPPAPADNKGLEVTLNSMDIGTRRLIDVQNNLAFRIFRHISHNTPGNLLFSPFSLASSLSLLFLGARGTSSESLNRVLPLDELVNFNPHLLFRNIISMLVNNQKSQEVAMVTQMFIKKEKGKVLEFFRSRASFFYRASVSQVPFENIGDVVRDLTNQWVGNQTEGRTLDFIKTPIDLNPSLSIMMANTFTSEWFKPELMKDTEMNFINLPRHRRLIKIPAIRLIGETHIGYDPVLDATMAELPYAGKKHSLIMVLPGKIGEFTSNALPSLENKLNSYTWSGLLKKMLSLEAEIEAPIFSHISHLNLTSTLRDLGLEPLFSNSDFSGINGLQDLSLGDAYQVNSITVKRSLNSKIPVHKQLRPKISFNRDFLYIVRHNPTGLILHIGKYVNPLE